jgi:hypothetical protein
VFCVLIVESGDNASKEQMDVVVRWVNSEGLVKERFLVTFIKRYVLEIINNNVILVYFQEIDDRRFSL